jgi:hypothetical protein
MRNIYKVLKLKIKNFVFNNNNNKNFINKIIAKLILLIFSFYIKIKTFLFILYNTLLIFLFLSNKEKKEVIIVHDLFSSPQTIGDFLYNYFFSRYFIFKNYKVKLVIIKDEYRQDWDLNEQKINTYIETITQISSTFSNCNKNFNLVKINWHDFNKNYLNDKKYYIPFLNAIKKRFRLYQYTQNTLNYLISFCSKEFKQYFLLDKKYFNEIKTISINNKYIAWHCRYDISGGTPRNIDRDSFDKIYFILRKYYNNYDIMIVSDKLGCDLAKDWGKNYNLLYSKDYSNDFLGDVKLVLNSEFYFQFRGGGMGTIALFSKIPYLQICDIYYLYMYKKYRLTSYAFKNQIVFNRNVLCEFSEAFLVKYNKIIKQ